MTTKDACLSMKKQEKIIEKGGYITQYSVVKEQLREALAKIAKFLTPEQPEVIEVQ